MERDREKERERDGKSGEEKSGIGERAIGRKREMRVRARQGQIRRNG